MHYPVGILYRATFGLFFWFWPCPLVFFGTEEIQAFKIAISVDSNHAESYCNLAALEVRKQVRMQGENTLSNLSQTFLFTTVHFSWSLS